MIEQDSLIRLALALSSNKGAYALLIGSGVSRSASIPTGYEVTLELIRQTAALYKEDCGNDPERWFKSKFDSEPGYSALLDRLGTTATERHGFLKRFFEPTEIEREEGKKQPTVAHVAIAKLVAAGIVRVIVTTNFDRLIEKAIQDEGIMPTVIASADDSEGSVPLVHSRCTIIKVNGDYLDHRAKNTLNELSDYDPRLNKLLDQVFDEFGLIVCGWSGDWDVALREAIERVKGRRYSCFWCTKGEPSAIAKKLIVHRAAVEVPIEDANQFFASLQDKITALEEMGRPHPLSGKLAVASLKRYIAEDKYRIRLDDLIRTEQHSVADRVFSSKYDMTLPHPTGENMEARVDQYAKDLTILLDLVINGCWWGKPEHDALWLRCINQLCTFEPSGGLNIWVDLRILPASLLMYGAGIAAIQADRYDLLVKLLTEPKIKILNRVEPALKHLAPFHLLNGNAKLMPSKKDLVTPMNEKFSDILRPHFADLIRNETEFNSAFDRYEYFLSLIYADKFNEISEQQTDSWSPPGIYIWRDRGQSDALKAIGIEASEKGENWKPLTDGLFQKKADRFRLCKKSVDDFAAKVRFQWRMF